MKIKNKILKNMNAEQIIEQAWINCSVAETMEECLAIIKKAKLKIQNLENDTAHS